MCFGSGESSERDTRTPEQIAADRKARVARGIANTKEAIERLQAQLAIQEQALAVS